MPLIVRCPGCSAEASVPDPLRGTAVLCPTCQRRFTAPKDAVTTTYASPPVSRPVAPPPDDRKYCVHCGTAIRRNATTCPSCSATQPNFAAPTMAQAFRASLPEQEISMSRRIAAGVAGLLLGCIGLHKFILGYVGEGLIMLVVTMTGFGALPMWIIGVAEGVIYLTKSDAEFHATYVVGKKGWF